MVIAALELNLNFLCIDLFLAFNMQIVCTCIDQAWTEECTVCDKTAEGKAQH